MKNKILFFILAFVLVGFSAKSQSSDVSYGIRGGINFQTFAGQDINGDKLNINTVQRFNLGLVIETHVANQTFFQTGLQLSTKGARSNYYFQNMDMSAEYNLTYLEVPLNLVFKPALGNGHLLVGFGPYLAYGLGGNVNYDFSDYSATESIVFTNNYESTDPTDWRYFKHLDYGGNLLLGYELPSGLSFQFNAQLGLAKINALDLSYDNEKTIFRNSGYGLSIGYMF
jgi:hypothetical protein